MILEKDNVRLRAIEPEDIDFILEMENNSDLWHLSNTHNPFSRFDIEQYVMLADKDIYSAQQLRLMIVNKYEGSRVGMIDIFDFDAHNRRAGIGILIIEEERSKGFAGNALDILVEYMFDHLSVHQLYCNINVDNSESIYLFEKKGFVCIGNKKDWNLVQGNWVDENSYQLIVDNQ